MRTFAVRDEIFLPPQDILHAINSSQTPLVIRGAASRWPGMVHAHGVTMIITKLLQTWSPQYLAEQWGSVSTALCLLAIGS